MHTNSYSVAGCISAGIVNHYFVNNPLKKEK